MNVRNSTDNKPGIRFAGYTDAWEKRKLGDLGSVSMNKRIFKEQTSDAGDIPFYKIGTFGGRPDSFISRALFEDYKSKYQYPEVGDVLISASGSIGRTVVYQGYDEYFQDSNIVWLKHDSQLDNLFLKQFYSIVKWQGLEGSTIKRLYNKNILETKITLPSPGEQNKIGKLFDYIDNLITVNHRKGEKLQELKKALLQKMFVSENNDIPEIRFSGYTDAWEKRKLREVIELEFKGKAKASMLGIKSIYLDTEYLNGGNAKYVDSKPDVQKDNVIILWDGSQAGTVYYGFKGALGSTLKAYRSSKSGLFLYQYLKLHQKEIYNKYRTPNIPHVVKNFTSLFTIMDTTIEEQEKIGAFLKHLDNLITVNQRKVEKLQELKKALLQKMFV